MSVNSLSKVFEDFLGSNLAFFFEGSIAGVTKETLIQQKIASMSEDETLNVKV